MTKIGKWLILASFWQLETFGQTVLPDISLLIGQKLMGNAKIEKCEWDIFTVPRMIDLYFISSKL